MVHGGPVVEDPNGRRNVPEAGVNEIRSILTQPQTDWRFSYVDQTRLQVEPLATVSQNLGILTASRLRATPFIPLYAGMQAVNMVVNPTADRTGAQSLIVAGGATYGLARVLSTAASVLPRVAQFAASSPVAKIGLVISGAGVALDTANDFLNPNRKVATEIQRTDRENRPWHSTTQDKITSSTR